MIRTGSLSGSRDVEVLLNAAFETNNLQCICRAVDAAMIRCGSITEIARAAELDRVTLYRAFRLQRGLALGNMIKVLRVLGFRLVVEVRREFANSHISDVLAEGEGDAIKRAAATARRFTAAFKTGEMNSLVKVFRETLQAQQNVAEFAGKTIRTREALYRVFTQNPMPRFSTLLSFLNALELQFAVRRLPRSKTPRAPTKHLE
jgi:DNA-binding phage protein